MSIQSISFLIDDLFQSKQLKSIDINHQNIFLQGLSGSSKTLTIGQLFNKSDFDFFCVLKDKEEAVYFANDLKTIVEANKILFFPFSYKRTLKEKKQDSSSVVLRTEVLNKLQKSESNYIIVTYPEALIEKVASKSAIQNSILDIKVGQNLSIEFIHELLDEQNFEKVDFVFEPGQYSVRGSLIDIFSYSNEFPYRIDFFGNDIESIRTFDVENQLSKTKLNEISIIPYLQSNHTSENSSILQFIEPSTRLVFDDLSIIVEKMLRLAG
jgi:transcription-repair coupling factor (superfamily II helicase)